MFERESQPMKHKLSPKATHKFSKCKIFSFTNSIFRKQFLHPHRALFYIPVVQKHQSQWIFFPVVLTSNVTCAGSVTT